MWKVKVLIQFILSHIPMGEKINYMLQLANNSHSVEKTENRIAELVTSMKKINEFISLEGAEVVEIGTGWEPICSTLLYMMGVKTCYTYDHVPHLRFNLTEMVINSIENRLEEIARITEIPIATLEKRLSILKSCKTLEDFFWKTNIVYKAPGDASNTGLKVESIDLVFSHAVLEHVPEKVVIALTDEAKRILKKNGFTYHLIGLGDHYNDVDPKVTTVNFLKYSEPVWAFFVKNRISYHNRLREKHFFKIFENMGAKVVWSANVTIPEDLESLKTMKINKAFSSMTLEELAVYRTEMILSFNK